MDNIEYSIIIENLSKDYKLYTSPIHRVKEAFHPFRKRYNTTFQALRDVSVSIKKGETFGIIGRNGCGKSTLLQIICGIMPPTSGKVTVNGKISAILELGAGFNPEFTGRDNVYLNCSILGMDRSEIDEQINEIISFADIGQFIDQPVKCYSSGMVIRLAFSIAINVNPQILIIDEALAVGDAAFQRKCYSKIHSIQSNGATILFVSHDSGAILQLCNRAMLVEDGSCIYIGNPKTAITFYHKLLFARNEHVDLIKQQIIDVYHNNNMNNQNTVDSDRIVDVNQNNDSNNFDKSSASFFNRHLLSKSTVKYEPNGAEIQAPWITTLDGKKVNVLVRGERYRYNYNVHFINDCFFVKFGMLIKTVSGLELGGYGSVFEHQSMDVVKCGSVVRVFMEFNCILLPNFYFINAGVIGVVNKNEQYLHRVVDAIMFEVMTEKNICATSLIDFGITQNISLDG